MRKFALLAAVAFSVTSASAGAQSLTLVGTFDGNQCKGGPITSCYASGTTAGSGALSTTAGSGSPGIARIDIPDGFTGTLTSGDFSITLNSNNTLSYTYNMLAGDLTAHYIGLFNGGGAASGTGTGFNNTYQLFYSADAITSGTLNLSTYFHNAGLSHIDFFDTGGTPRSVPEPATWAMMLLGFGGIGAVMRRRNRKQALLQIA
jgi:hypothetical protein